ncbi:MAG: AraC family transcriptional regulator [Bacteroidales bacterium]|jgi:AraC-like DNA-binding protein|nr:AraC family transcriptional regulator [Bacteroidales bacterium]MDD2203708.1 AraC family transcriptional regulator [Bacteroidales bacterium]MDD3153007.1 AraC family transcriptional regulator [Bacteroidales bacterium]MDD3914959.1 AraC family transcriptional regulator [Bacteroidales bacterium]MDD4634835.1 AraC family transcriptional regulator [Bacteroidales bacterium]
MFNLVVYYVVFVQALFTGIVLLSRKTKSSSSKLLVGLVLVSIVDIAISILKYHGIVNKMPINCFVFAYGPIILLYLRSTLLRIKTLSIVNVIHFTPFIFFLCISLVLKGDQATFSYSFFKDNPTKVLYIVYYSLAYVSIIGYTIANLSCINYAKKNIEDLYSFEVGEKLLYWFRLLSMIFFLMFILQAITGLASIVTHNEVFDTNMFVIFGLGIFYFSLQYYLINEQVVFSDVKNNLYDIEAGAVVVDNYTKSKIPKDTLDKCAEKLVDIMDDKKLYLKNDLDLQDVSKSINYPKHYITQALNIVLKKNFYLFVNEYRINEFKAKIQNKKNDNLTIMAIALDSGFNSKSTFNTIFKKFTGQTPSEYAQNIRKMRDTAIKN